MKGGRKHVIRRTNKERQIYRRERSHEGNQEGREKRIIMKERKQDGKENEESRQKGN